MMQSLYKNWLLVSKITWKIWTTSDKQWKVQKVEIWWATFVKKIHLSTKYIASAKTFYIEDLSNITFNYLCENSQNLLCHFWNHKIFFISHNSYVFFLAQTLHTFYKISPWKCKLLNFLLLWLNFTKFLMPFFKQKVSFSSKPGFFICHER